MLRKMNSASKAGFTLVEIMIVVAIIALLAAIAVPNFLRARKRSQATALLEDMRMIDAAKDQYAIENNLLGATTLDWQKVKVHVKPGTRLALETGNTPSDLLGKPVVLGAVDVPPTLDDTTIQNFSDLFEDSAAAKKFWGSYKAGSN